MKKTALLLTAAALLGMSSPLHAINFTARGEWLMSFELGQHGAFTGGNGMTGYGRADEDSFEARQRLRLQLEATASEALSGTVFLEIGDQRWGKASDGAALGADGAVVAVKHAYLDWIPPQTDLRLRMGLQEIALPSFTTGSQVFADDAAAISASWQINEHVTIAPFWARLFNDNFSGYTQSGRTTQQNFKDNVDSVGLILPLQFEGLRVTPWAMYTAIGPNAFRYEDHPWGAFSHEQFYGGMLPAGGSSHQEALSLYGSAFWAGLTGQVSLWEPFRFAWDVNYGQVNYDDHAANRQGWLGSVLFEYAADWVTLGLYGWYGSGDNGNRGDGSERLPSLSLMSADNGFSSFAFTGNPYIGRENAIGWSMAGTWGVGFRLKDISVVEDVRQTLRLNLIGGTNSPAAGRALCQAGLAANSGSFGAAGMEGLYLTTQDYALEFGLSSYTKIYENMTVGLEASYIALWLENDVWGASRLNGRNDNVRDAWNIAVTYAYAF